METKISSGGGSGVRINILEGLNFEITYLSGRLLADVIIYKWLYGTKAYVRCKYKKTKYTMKTIHKLTVGILILLFSSCKTEPSKIEFEGRRFELPIKVAEAKEKLGLLYGYYSGFFFGNVNEPSIETQLEDYPLFMGSDNDSEESYKDHYFVGITFFQENKNLDELKKEFEKKYNRNFETKTKDFITRTMPPFKMTYHYIKTEEGLFVALKEIERNPKKKKYISTSFYKDISESELEKYLEYVH